MKKLTGIAFAMVIVISVKAQMDQSDANMENSKEPTEDSLFLYHYRLTSKYENPEMWNEKTQEIVTKHGVFLDKLGQEGILILAGRTQYQPGHESLFGLVVIKANSIEKATLLIKNDPVIIGGVMHTKIHPYSMGIRYFDNLKD